MPLRIGEPCFALVRNGEIVANLGEPLPVTVFLGGASIFTIHPVTEEVSRHVAKQSRYQPVNTWDFPQQLLPAPTRRDELDDYDPRYDRDDREPESRAT